jgi:hypothetical protein
MASRAASLAWMSSRSQISRSRSEISRAPMRRRSKRWQRERMVAGNLLRLGGGEEEFDVGGRLFQRLQQGVEGVDGEHVHFVDDVDLVAAVGGAEADVVADFPHRLDAVVAGAVDLQHVHGIAGGDFQAVRAGVAGLGGRTLLAVEGLGENAGGSGLAGAARTHKEIGVRHAVLFDGAGQGVGDMALSHHIREGLGTVFPG